MYALPQVKTMYTLDCNPNPFWALFFLWLGLGLGFGQFYRCGVDLLRSYYHTSSLLY